MEKIHNYIYYKSRNKFKISLDTSCMYFYYISVINFLQKF